MKGIIETLRRNGLSVNVREGRDNKLYADITGTSIETYGTDNEDLEIAISEALIAYAMYSIRTGIEESEDAFYNDRYRE